MPPAPRELGRAAAADGAARVQDLHPHDRGPEEHDFGATVSNGNLDLSGHPGGVVGHRTAGP